MVGDAPPPPIGALANSETSNKSGPLFLILTLHLGQVISLCLSFLSKGLVKRNELCQEISRSFLAFHFYYL